MFARDFISTMRAMSNGLSRYQKVVFPAGYTLASGKAKFSHVDQTYPGNSTFYDIARRNVWERVMGNAISDAVCVVEERTNGDFNGNMSAGALRAEDVKAEWHTPQHMVNDQTERYFPLIVKNPITVVKESQDIRRLSEKSKWFQLSMPALCRFSDGFNSLYSEVDLKSKYLYLAPGAVEDSALESNVVPVIVYKRSRRTSSKSSSRRANKKSLKRKGKKSSDFDAGEEYDEEVMVPNRESVWDEDSDDDSVRRLGGKGSKSKPKGKSKYDLDEDSDDDSVRRLGGKGSKSKKKLKPSRIRGSLSDEDSEWDFDEEDRMGKNRTSRSVIKGKRGTRESDSEADDNRDLRRAIEDLGSVMNILSGLAASKDNANASKRSRGKTDGNDKGNRRSLFTRKRK